jgi:DNA-binding transcriptional LysR family regulator
VRLHEIDLNLLVAFDALLRECHVTRAAHRLRISQSSMSLALAKLRVLFHDPLLVKAAGGLQPTIKARNLQPQVEEVLRHIDRLVHDQNAFDPAEANETVTMIVIDYIDFVVMPDLMSRLQREASNLALRIVGPNPRRLAEIMANGEIDMALTYFPAPPDSVRTRPLFTDRLVGIARNGHPMLEHGISVDSFCAQAHVAIEPAEGASMYNELVDDALRDLGLARRIALSKTTFLGVPFLVAQTDLVATLPERVAQRFATMAPITLFEPPLKLARLDIVMMWHDRTHNNPLHQWLREVIVDVCARWRKPGALSATDVSGIT